MKKIHILLLIVLIIICISFGYFLKIAGEGYKLAGMSSLERCDQYTDFDLINELKLIDDTPW